MTIAQQKRKYFFCGIGGSGMLPLSVLMLARDCVISGSDRGFDQGKTPDKAAMLRAAGVTLYPQDGSGITAERPDYLVVSSAIEPSIPDVRVAMDLGIPIIKRGALLAEQFNAALTGIAVAGTSGKSTVTGMIGTLLLGLGANPTIVNGGGIRNMPSAFPGVHVGREDLCVAEMDESDGSIADYRPTIAVLNNIALDHKTMAELEGLFGAYLSRTEKTVVVNADHAGVMDLVHKTKTQAARVTYGFAEGVDIQGLEFTPLADGFSMQIKTPQGVFPLRLKVPGQHNASNALAALCVAKALNLDMAQACAALEDFGGIHRRLETIGTSPLGVTVIDDFAHNPDKIAASLRALKTFDGRLILLFQPHGFGPLKLMGREIADEFSAQLGAGDILLMPEAYYAGGTVDRSVTARDVIAMVTARGCDARWFETREACFPVILAEAKPGDRVVIMGARDDTLHTFAQSVLKALA